MSVDFDKFVLKRLSQIPVGAVIKVRDMAKKDPIGFSNSVKRLIACGWSEYEFTDDYSAVRRLNLPDYARDYFKKLRNEYTNTKRN